MNKGDVVTLVATDVHKVFWFSQSVNQLWATPVLFAICIYQLFTLLGISALAAVVVLLAVGPLTYLLSRSFKVPFLSLSLLSHVLNLSLFSEFAGRVDGASRKETQGAERNTARHPRSETLRMGIGHEETSRRPPPTRTQGYPSMELQHRDYYVYRNGFINPALCQHICCIYFIGYVCYIFLAAFSIKTHYFFPPHHFSGNPLQASVLFPALYLFGVVLWPLLDFPWGLSNLAAARTSVQRLRTFLAMEELPSLPVLSADSPSGLAVRISSGEFWWPAVPPSKDSDKAANKSEDNNNNNKNTKGDDKEKEEDFDSVSNNKKRRNDNHLTAKSNEEQRGLLDASSSDDDDDGEGGNEQHPTVPKHIRSALRDIHFEVERGALVAIVGEVGSGKSALLHSLLGELHRSKGEL